MSILVALVVVMAVAWAAWTAVIVMRGNNYHALVRQAVIAQVGAKATPYLESRPIIEQITNAFRRGDPASSAALALAMLIEQGEREDEDTDEPEHVEAEYEQEEEQEEEEEDEREDSDEEAFTAEPTPTLHKVSPSPMDAVIRAVYGDHPPAKSGDLERAITIAHEDLLSEQVTLSQVEQVATALFRGPVPYSTHDLAVSTALAFFKKPEFQEMLQESQLSARLRVLNWGKAGKVVPPLAQAFETVLYRIYKPA